MRLVVVLLFLSALVNIPLLVNNGIFWDDWTLFNMSREGLDDQFRGAGPYYLADFHETLHQVQKPVLLYRLLTLLFSTGSVLLFYRILLHIKELGKKELFYMAAIFAVLPFFSTKATMICIPYTICVCLFLLGFYLFIRIADKPNLLLRTLSLIFFFISFITNSLLFFFLVIPLYVWYVKRGVTLRQVLSDWFKFADFMILPIVYWIIKTVYFNPTYFYALRGYNEIELRRLFYLPIQFIATLNETFLGTLSLFYNNTHPYILIVLVFVVVVVGRKLHIFNTYLFRSPAPLLTSSIYKKIAMVGMLLLFIGAFPYLLVGKVPSFIGFETRHQLLLPIGVSILLVALISLLVVEKYRSLVFFAFIILFAAVNIQLQYRYLVGWFKQESIMANLKLSPFPMGHTTFEIIDNAEFYSPTERPINFYEWGGMAKLVTRSENRLFVSSDLWNDIPQGSTLTDFVKLRIENKAMTQRNMKYYFPDGSCCKMIVSPTGQNLASPFQVFNLLKLYYFSRDDFNRVIPKFLKISFDEPCSDKLNSIL